MKHKKASLKFTIAGAALLAVLALPLAAYAQTQAVFGGTPPVVQLSAGLYHSCALLSDGSVQCWGGNAYGQATNQAGPFIQISAGNLHTCGLKSWGSVVCWGSNFFGQASYQAGPFTQVTAGMENTCGVKTNGDLYCWGDVGNRVYGVETGPFTQADISAYHACAITPSLSATPSRPAGVHCWGSDSFGDVADHFGNYTQITVGGYHNCALWLTGNVDCWGSNLYGQSSPPHDYDFFQVSAGHLFTCGIQSNYSVACWGYNFYGQVSDRPPITSKFNQVAAGYGHACATDGYHVSCWGRNDHGQATPALCLGDCGPPRTMFSFQGWYPPLAPEQADPTLNAAEAGSAAPLKFSLGGNKGTDVIQAGYPASRQMACDQFEPMSAWEPVQSAGNHGLSFEMQSETYTYVWKTDRTWAGTCRVLALKLADGTEHLAGFRFR